MDQLPKAPFTSKKPFIIVARVAIAFLIAVVILVVWRALLPPKLISDGEAREYFAQLEETISHGDGEATCAMAIFDMQCTKTMLAVDSPSAMPATRIVCTWPLAEDGSDRVLEIEGEKADGTAYRTSLSVSWDNGTLKGWPMPYWEYPVRSVPSDSEPVEELPSDVDLGIRFDPCQSPDAKS